MRLVYFGTSEFAVPALRALAEHVILVVTQPDRPAGRGRELRPSPVKLAAQELALPVDAPEKAREAEFVARIAALEADALVVASYGQILSEALLGAAKRGGINLHASLLPKYRGAAPIQRAILAGERATGITLMQMDKGMDTGDIIATTEVPIGPDETAGELEARLANAAADMAASNLPRIVLGDYVRAPQDAALATVAHKMTREDGKIGFWQAADEAYCVYRACTPRPGCWIFTSKGVLKLSQCRPADGNALPGEVIGVEGGRLTVGFANGSLDLVTVQPEGRRAMTGAEFANGAHLGPGMNLKPDSANPGNP